MSSKVVVIKTSPTTILTDYRRLLHLAEYEKYISKYKDTILKLNLSWNKFFPASNTPPWQLEGVVKTLLEDRFAKEKIFPVENKTVVTDPIQGANKNLWAPILKHYGLSFIPLPQVEWTRYEFKSEFLKLNQIFPEGFEIPKMFIGKQIIHLPTVKTHGHSVTTGAIKNSFGGLLKEFRHYAHKYIHEVLVDLMLMQRELHPSMFAVMDGTVCGDGAGPRTMTPVIKNFILASADQVAIDAVAAKMMGFNPMEIPYLRMCDERGLGKADLKEIELIGEDISKVNFGFTAKKSLVIWGDQLLRKGPLKFLEKIALHSFLKFWAPMASNIYHDFFWYPTIGQLNKRRFKKTEWGRVFQSYRTKYKRMSS